MRTKNTKKTLNYKGYVGSVAFSEEDNLLYGEIQGINAAVAYEGKTMQELTASFREAVEDYLAFCKDHCLKPQKSYSGAFNVRISSTTHRDIAMRALEAGITINAFVKKALDEAVKAPSHAPEPAMLMDEPKVQNSERKSVRFRIPARDLPFAKELAKRMGWEMLE